MGTIRIMRRASPLLALLLAACAGAGVPPQPRSPVERGEALFVEHGCYGCHTVRGTGTPIANDLTHVGAKYGEKELALRVRDPAVHRPGAHMPTLDLSAADADALAAYLATLH